MPDFPKFFDYATSYYPNQSKAESIGIDPSTVYRTPSISVIGDRIVAKEFEAHWKQQKDILKSKGENRPIFTLVSTVDGHMPYKGYDMPQFYPKIDPSIKPHTEQFRVANFIKVNTYTDKYFIKEVINWLKDNDPNTIVLFTGDHGTRDIPAKEKNGKVTENVKYDPKCVHESTVSDATFSEKIDKSGWRSISMVSHMIEYHNGMRMVRFHPGDIEGAHVYKNCVFFSFFVLLIRKSFHPGDFDESKDKRNFYVIREQKNKNEKKKGLEFVNEALAFLSAENYLAAKNRLFNYKFRDEKCVINKNCELPEKLPDLSFRDSF